MRLVPIFLPFNWLRAVIFSRVAKVYGTTLNQLSNATRSTPCRRERTRPTGAPLVAWISPDISAWYVGSLLILMNSTFSPRFWKKPFWLASICGTAVVGSKGTAIRMVSWAAALLAVQIAINNRKSKTRAAEARALRVEDGSLMPATLNRV